MVKNSGRGKEKERRRSFRYSTYLPIGISVGKSKPAPSLLRNISDHGLSFSVSRPLSSGTLVNITVPSVSRDFTFKARVIWCRAVEGGIHTVGVAFIEEDGGFNTRLVDLVCRIDRYRAKALEKGRKLSFEEAAAEWIKKFAKILPE